MSRLKSSVAIVAIVVGAVVVPATAAIAGDDWVGGGHHTYGTNSSIVWSDYWHPITCHGSSVQGKTYQKVSGYGPFTTSHAQAASRPNVVDQAWYHFC